jgi:hypothetical protein
VGVWSVAAIRAKLKGLSKEELKELKRTGKLKEMLGDAYDSDDSLIRDDSSFVLDDRR